MRSFDQCMQVLQDFPADGQPHKGIGIFLDGMTEICAEREKQTDRVRGTSRHNDAFTLRPRLSRQSQYFGEALWDREVETFNQIRAIASHLGGRVQWQRP